MREVSALLSIIVPALCGAGFRIRDFEEDVDNVAADTLARLVTAEVDIAIGGNESKTEAEYNGEKGLKTALIVMICKCFQT